VVFGTFITSVLPPTLKQVAFSSTSPMIESIQNVEAAVKYACRVGAKRL
jgi:hypothetical protein